MTNKFNHNLLTTKYISSAILGGTHVTQRVTHTIL